MASVWRNASSTNSLTCSSQRSPSVLASRRIEHPPFSQGAPHERSMGHARELIRRVDKEISRNLGLQTTVDFRRALEETERRIPNEHQIYVTRQARVSPYKRTKEDNTLHS